MNMRKHALGGLMAISLSLASSQALAVCDGCVTGAIAKATMVLSGVVEGAGGAITQAIGTSATSIVNGGKTDANYIVRAIGDMSTIVEGQVKAGTSANIDMLKTMTDTTNNQNNYREKQKFLAEKGMQVARGAPCEDVTAIAAKAMGKAASAAAGAGAKSNREHINEKTTSLSPQAEVKKKTANHNQNYCGPGDTDCGVAPADFQHADQTAASLFTGASADGKVYLTFDEKRLQAGRDYINNVFKPIASPRLDPEVEKTPQGQAYMALHRAETSKVSLASKASFDIHAARDPKNAKINGKSLGAALKEMWEKQGFASTATAVNGEIGYNEMVDIEATRRYTNPKWYAAIASGDDSQIMKEIAYMQALEINQRHRQIKLAEEQLVVSSAMLNEMLEVNSGPKLSAQREAAIKSVR